MKLAANYCIYENSGHLAESVFRIYPLVDKILFSLNFNPWAGVANPSLLAESYSDILKLPDPDNKFEIVTNYWENETDQRNAAKAYLEKLGFDWYWLIDDDEMYNRDEIKYAISFIKSGPNDVHTYLIKQKMYWKSKDYVISEILAGLPVFIRCNNQAYHNMNRAIIVNGFWHTFPQDKIVMHHFSYVRSDEKIKRKISMFSHSNEIKHNWFDTVWMNWTPDMENISPTNPTSWKKAVLANTLPSKLENITSLKLK